VLSYAITPLDHCRRFESFLRTLLPTAPSGYPRKLIKNGAAKLNGSSATPDTFLAGNDIVTLKESASLTALLHSERPLLDILYENDQIVIANKPAGLAMHRTAELEGDLVEESTAYMAWRGTPCKLYPVNRLDRGTSGAVILAKSSSSAGIHGRQIKETGLDKLYLALVSGVPPTSGVITEPLDEKESETRYEILLAGTDCSLLAVTPISGRMHQIRRHLESIGHPVLGDSRYGGGELAGYDGFALHSFRTALLLPTGIPLTVCAPLPENLLAVCEERSIARLQLLAAVQELAIHREITT
jgi:23S rRNA pseudouridine955/2504/2580 synthase